MPAKKTKSKVTRKSKKVKANEQPQVEVVQTEAPIEQKKEVSKVEKKKGKLPKEKLVAYAKKIQEYAKKLRETKGISHREAVKQSAAKLKSEGYFSK